MEDSRHDDGLFVEVATTKVSKFLTDLNFFG